MIHFDVDADQLNEVGRELEASSKEIRFALTRALKRTASTLRKESSKGLQSELGLRRAAAIRRRLKQLRVRSRRDMTSITLWYGLNDLPVSEFKGSLSASSSGATLTGPIGSHTFQRGFIRRLKNGRRTILQRQGDKAYPVNQAQVPIKDRADVFLEDEIFLNLESIFWHHFRADLTRRVAYIRSR